MLAAFLVDLAVGDPSWLPHPVVLIGKLIDRLEKLLRRIFHRPAGLRLAGVLLALTVVSAAWAATAFLLWLAGLVHPWLAVVLNVWLISTTMATRSLASAARAVLQPLTAGDLCLARQRVGWIVGRDTAAMDAADVTRATVETVAENIVDGFVSPLFFALLGGAPLAMAYRAVNTLDSMVGYRNERFRDLGWFSARLDDAANFLSARWTALCLLAAAWLSGRRTGEAWRAVRRDAPAHPSPNSGWPEAAMAGALGVRLGGLNYYGGRAQMRAYMGEPHLHLQPDHVRQAVDMMYLAAALAVLSGMLAARLAGAVF
ncbi:adenosylcobinamide-phosphate synthase CbiB [Desulfotomaculum copahuensis]|uniref:adenosylcobinamide-phosphate synthase CbiB n=1 Tax=Desulfotomaculum copahuensis TaxID=1838280 RepID=UPI0031F3D451